MKSTDTVKAKLTPREAILNRNAAELLGRHNIARLNAHGNMLAKRGVDLASDPGPHPAGQNLEGYQMGTPDVMDDRTDLMREADSTFYGGGQAPMPTPTPTPIPQRYQYGTEDVRRRRMNAASRITGLRTPPQRMITNYSGAPSAYGSQGILGPDQNPAYQAALRNNPTPASRYAQRGGQASLAGTYQGTEGQRAVVSTGANTFRTYDPQGGYIGRIGNSANFLNRQINADTSNAAPQAVAPIQPMVATTPTSLSVNTPGFQPSGLEANPFTEPVKLELQQPRRYSDLY